MSQEMRDMLNRHTELVSKNLNHLKRRLTTEIMEDIVNVNTINESSLSRVESHLNKHDCAIITSFRSKMINCVKDEQSDDILNIFKNKGRNIPLKSALLYLGYGVTKVKGSYIENYLEDNAVEVKEDSFFVVNVNDDYGFIENIIELGVIFCQDSVLIMSQGGNNNYLVGTNYSDYPGYQNIDVIGKFVPNKEGEFMTRVNRKPFVIETFKESQINTKKLIKEWGRHIVDMVRNK
jgi:hypothetical protein